MPRPSARIACLAAALLPVPDAAIEAAAPRVVASIAPIHSLVAGVTGEAAAPRLLVPGGRSPHTFALAPSGTRALAHADAVFLAGGPTEHFLERPLASLAGDASVVRMTDLPGVRLLEARAGGALGQEQPRADGHGDGHAHGAGEFDPHVWLDPANAIAFTGAAARVLARIDPANADAYESNADRRIERLRALEAALARELAPAADRPYLVFHDAYQYLEARYGLAAAGAITVDPGRPPGARRLGELRERIRAEDIRCLFVEPQFEPDIAGTVAEGTGVRVVTLDPLGAGLEPGPELYFELMRGLARDLRGCLFRDS